MRHFLDFEKPLAELEGKIEELRRMSEPEGLNIADEVGRLTEKADKQLRATYAKLTPWQKTQVARHPDRPKALDYIRQLIADFTPLAGDPPPSRTPRPSSAASAASAGTSVVIIGTEKGSDTDTRVKHNFGSAKPEGYRKARRLIELAGRFNLPLLTFVDTSGAFPGIDAEARGQAEAIARSIEACLEAPIPIVATVIGEGGSGGAIALATGNKVLMLEHAIYSVISPEGCATILWREAAQAAAAADALKLTAADLKALALVDEVISEPLGGAHRDPNRGHGGGRRLHRSVAAAAPGPGPRRPAHAAPREIPRHGARGCGRGVGRKRFFLKKEAKTLCDFPRAAGEANPL